MRCTRCAATLTNAANFCPNCGAEVAASTRRPGELRQLTVMFIDLVGSTPMSEQLDPERLREVVRAYQTHVGDVVERRGGTIAQYLGDGVLVYFGFPRAHEDDAERAILAGLDVFASLAALNEQLERDYGVGIRLRLGIHSGEVVVGELGSEERREVLAIGKTVNVAARIANVIPPDVPVVSEATRRLAEGAFVFEALASFDLKGVSEPVLTHRVAHARDPLERRATGPDPVWLVGRQAELALLAERYARAASARAQAVVVSGEGGIGKTHLLQAFRDRLTDHDPIWLEGRCSHFHQASALYPMTQAIEQGLELSGCATPEGAVERLRERLTSVPGDRDRLVGLIASLLSLPAVECFGLLEIDPQRLRSETIDAIADVLVNLAEIKPVVLVLEDLQWVDPSTPEVLSHLMERGAQARLLLLGTQRPDEEQQRPDEEQRPSHVPAVATRIELQRLDRDETASLVALHSGDRALSPEVVDHIVSRSDGVPLFVEELTRMVVESNAALVREGEPRAGGGVAPVDELGVPAMLQGLLMARLDRLELGKPVGQLAATIGRPFSIELLRELSDLAEDEVRSGLEQLLAADLVRSADSGHAAEFAFKDKLVREAAYRSLLLRDRTRLHGRIARVLEKRSPEFAHSQPELLAHHHLAGGDKERAISLWEWAGHLAIAKSAAAEALLYYNRALEQLLTLPPASQRDLRELDLRMATGNALITTEGYASHNVESELEKAAALCDRIGETPQLFTAVNGLWGYHLVRGDLEATEQLMGRLGEYAEDSKRKSHFLRARHAVGATAFYKGDFEAALPVLADATERYGEMFDARMERGVTRPWRHTATSAPMYLGWCLHMLGRPDEGLAQQMHALEQAKQLGEAYVHVEAMTHLVALHHDRREPQRTLDFSDTIISISEELGFRFWLGIGKSASGWARGHLGEVDAGLEEITEGLDIFRSTGSRVPLVYRVSYLAELLLLAGRAAQGLAVCDEALERSRGKLDRFYDAELLRLRAEFLKQLGADSADVEAELERSIDLARRQGARILELRATVGLTRVLGERDAAAGSLERLASLYARFEEGFEMPDLAEAHALLEGAAAR